MWTARRLHKCCLSNFGYENIAKWPQRSFICCYGFSFDVIIIIDVQCRFIIGINGYLSANSPKSIFKSRDFEIIRSIRLWNFLEAKILDPGWSELILIGRLTILVLVGCGILWIPILESQNNSQLFDYIQSVIHFLCPPIGISLIFGSIKLQQKIWTDQSGFIRYGNILGENKWGWCILGTCCWTHYGNRSDDYCFYYSGTWLWWTRYQDRAYQFSLSTKLTQSSQGYVDVGNEMCWWQR